MVIGQDMVGQLCITRFPLFDSSDCHTILRLIVIINQQVFDLVVRFRFSKVIRIKPQIEILSAAVLPSTYQIITRMITAVVLRMVAFNAPDVENITLYDIRF